MRDEKSRAQGKGHGDGRDCRAAHERLADRVEDDEARVAEDGDRDHPAHELYGDDGVVLAHELDHHIRELQGTACLFEDRADHRTEDDDDADARKRSRESLSDDRRQTILYRTVCELVVDERNAGGKPKRERDQHDRDERVNAQL